jgi:hypothetical protein
MIEDQEADIDRVGDALERDIDAVGMSASHIRGVVKHDLATWCKPVCSAEPGNSCADDCNPWPGAVRTQDHAAARVPVLSCSIRA